MKRILLYLVTGLLLAVSGFGQSTVYHPFPISNAFWGVDGWNIFSGACYNARYGLNGDTLINGLVYHKVYSLYDSTLTNPKSYFYAVIREQDKRIYTIINNSQEEILYDFNLEVGDTITWHYSLMFNAPEDFSRVVTQVDSIQLYNGEYRKRFSMEASGYNSLGDIVVEGIGSIIWRGLFNPLINAIATNGDQFSFTCFKQNESVLYLNNPRCDHCFCSLYTGIQTTEANNNLAFSPDPFSVQTTLRLNNQLENGSLLVYNSLGQEVRHISGLTGSLILLNRKNLSPGIYYLRLLDQNKVIGNSRVVIGD